MSVLPDSPAKSPIYRGPLPHVTTVERVPVTVYEQPGDASRAVAREIADLVTSRAEAGKQTVLGLATGSTPVGVYDELIRLHKEEGVSFKTVVTFNLDEYWPIAPDALQSYHRFMREHLFDHVDIPADAIHIPDGTLARDRVLTACLQYEERIREAGGIIIQVTRPSGCVAGEAMRHSSESGIDESLIDVTVHNSGSMAHLRRAVKATMEEYTPV